MVTIELPALTWGNPDADRRALLVHGLGSDAHTMWRIGEFFAVHGWCATAVDQRGHGRAPRTSRYRIEDYANDLLALPRERPWDVAVGHSIAGASLVMAHTVDPTFADRFIFIDPALHTTDEHRIEIRAGQVANHTTLTVEEQQQRNPHWHPLDWELTVAAHKNASLFAVEHSVLDNPDWDVLDHAEKLTVPTLVVQGDPAVLARYTDEHAARLEGTNPLISRTVIPGTGHSPHRDNPEEFTARVGHWLGF